MLHLILFTLLAAALGHSVGPCDIFSHAGTDCVAAHSTIRALFGSYNGALYQVKRASDGATKDIAVRSAGGFVNAVEQEQFCDKLDCIIFRIYDQSPRQNHLDVAPPGGAAPVPDKGVNASKLKVTVGGHTAYGAYFEKGMGYRNDKTSGVAVGDDPETLYMVVDGHHYNAGCCFDYGNAETDNNDQGAGTMEAIYWGAWNASQSGWSGGTGSGPWVMADLENGLWAGNQVPYNRDNTPILADYVTAMVKGGPNKFGLKGGDAQAGPLKTLYDGVRPLGYTRMQKQGALILGIGGDNSNSAVGTFFEGAIVSGYTTDAADDAVQANIVAAGYASHAPVVKCADIHGTWNTNHGVCKVITNAGVSGGDGCTWSMVCGDSGFWQGGIAVGDTVTSSASDSTNVYTGVFTDGNTVAWGADHAVVWTRITKQVTQFPNYV